MESISQAVECECLEALLDGASPVSATQIPLPSSPAQSVREDEPALHYGTAPRPADAIGKAEEKTGPMLQQSWEKLLSAVEKYDDGMVKNWKEDIDTLLVFAGLFSAIVTAFVIESYQWLSEDPADTTVTVLTQIAIQLNTSQPMPLVRPDFEPNASSIRINCFWFLSLVFSLTSALFGLLCKQWLREQQRDPPTKTPAEALALRQMRRDSFEKWGVSPFLSVLPILLEVALLLFFVGILDLLWNRHPIPFAFCFVAVVLSAGLYFFTMFLPVLALFLQRSSWLSYQFICPYKSPQAWAIYRLSIKVLHALDKIPFTKFYSQRWPGRLMTHIWSPASDWSSFDLAVIRQSSILSEASSSLNVYELRAFQWSFTIFQDSPSMLPHLQNVLGTIPPSAVMSAVLGDWNHTMWGDIQKSDVELWFRDRWALRRSMGWYIEYAPRPNLRDPTLLHSEGIGLLSFHQALRGIASRRGMYGHLIRYLVRTIQSHHADLQKLLNLRFVIPFTVIEKLWIHNDPNIRGQSSQLLPFFEEAFSMDPQYDEDRHDGERVHFSLHHQELILNWGRVTQRVTEIGHQPADYFAPILVFSEEPTAQATHAGISVLSINADHPQADGENNVRQSDLDMDNNDQAPWNKAGKALKSGELVLTGVYSSSELLSAHRTVYFGLTVSEQGKVDTPRPHATSACISLRHT
ncbi:hypothetical protein WG66_000917 [Moniliophthora roreri]|nr:hypothetical protein WG66_000917 [Moniliophthora roreri]